MQNVHLEAGIISQPCFVASVLRLFSDTSIPRSSIILDSHFLYAPEEFFEVSLLDALSKLTKFKTVVVKLLDSMPRRAGCCGVVGPFHEVLDKYLGATLGPGEEGRMADDFEFCCLTYHPQKHASSKETADVKSVSHHRHLLSYEIISLRYAAATWHPGRKTVLSSD